MAISSAAQTPAAGIPALTRITARQKGENFIAPTLSKKTNQTEHLQNAPLRSRSQLEQFAAKRAPAIAPVLAYNAAALVKSYTSARGSQIDTRA